MYFLIAVLIACTAGEIIASEPHLAGGGPKGTGAATQTKEPGTPSSVAAPQAKAEPVVTFAFLGERIESKTLTLAQVKSYLAGTISESDELTLLNGYAKKTMRDAEFFKRKVGLEGRSPVQKITFREFENVIAGLDLIHTVLEMNQKKESDKRVRCELDASELKNLRKSIVGWFDPLGLKAIKLDYKVEESVKKATMEKTLEDITIEAPLKQNAIATWLTGKYEERLTSQFKLLLDGEYFADPLILAVLENPGHPHGPLLRKAISNGYRVTSDLIQYIQFYIENPTKVEFEKAYAALEILEMNNREARYEDHSKKLVELRRQLLDNEKVVEFIFEEVEHALQRGEASMNAADKKAARKWFDLMNRCDFNKEEHAKRRVVLNDMFAKGIKPEKKSTKRRTHKKPVVESKSAEAGNNADGHATSISKRLSALLSPKGLVIGIATVAACYFGWQKYSASKGTVAAEKGKVPAK